MDGLQTKRLKKNNREQEGRNCNFKIERTRRKFIKWVRYITPNASRYSQNRL